MFYTGKHEGAQLDLTGGVCPRPAIPERPPEAPGPQPGLCIGLTAGSSRPGSPAEPREEPGLGEAWAVGLLQREDSVGHAG